MSVPMNMRRIAARHNAARYSRARGPRAPAAMSASAWARIRSTSVADNVRRCPPYQARPGRATWSSGLDAIRPRPARWRYQLASVATRRATVAGPKALTCALTKESMSAGVALNGRRPCSAHQDVNVARSVAYASRVFSGLPASQVPMRSLPTSLVAGPASRASMLSPGRDAGRTMHQRYRCRRRGHWHVTLTGGPHWRMPAGVAGWGRQLTILLSLSPSDRRWPPDPSAVTRNRSAPVACQRDVIYAERRPGSHARCNVAVGQV